MRNVNEAVILVTGSTDGLGELLARDLAAAGVTVLLHGREPGRLEAAAREVREASGGEEPRCYLADLSSLDEARRLAEEVRANHDRLDVLVNNAGIGAGERGARDRSLSRDGHELRFAVNYLAPFLLTRRLLPLLRRSAPARVVNVASGAQSPIDYARRFEREMPRASLFSVPGRDTSRWRTAPDAPEPRWPTSLPGSDSSASRENPGPAGSRTAAGPGLDRRRFARLYLAVGPEFSVAFSRY